MEENKGQTHDSHVQVWFTVLYRMPSEYKSFPMHSNGGGCSGLFICVHYQLDRIKLEGVVDFFSCIKVFLTKRPSLVACAVSEALYVIVLLSSVAEMLVCMMEFKMLICV